MHPGIVGALALIGTAGAIYFGSGYLNDYFATRNADTAIESAAQSEDAASTPSSLVGDVAEVPAEAAESEASAADMAQDVAETAMQEVASLADDVADTAANVVETVQETAEETLERVLEAAPRSETETSEQESASEPGTTPVLDIVRIEPTGEAVIAGNAPQGERVGLLYNNELIADAEVGAGGDFVLIPDAPIPSGEGTMEVVVIDEAGNTVTPSQEQVAVVLPEDGSDEGFLVGVLRPNEPVDIIERQAPEAASDAPEVEVAVRIEPATPAETPATEADLTATDAAEESVQAPEVEVAARVEPTQPVETEQAAGVDAFIVVDAIELEGQEMWIAGGALPGTVIRLYQDNIFLGEVITGEEGRYLFEGTLLESDGEVTVRADALVTGSADVIARAEVPFEVPLSSAQVAAVALEQVEDVVAAVEETTTEIAQATQEIAQTTQDQVADATQDQVADAVETASEVSADIAETVQEQAAIAVEAASEVASAVVDTAADAAAVTPTDPAVSTAADVVVDTAVEAVEAVQETVAAAVETPAEVADATSAQIADAADTAVETAQAVADVAEEVAQTTELAPGANVEAPPVEIAATTTPTATPSTPPTEALTQALEEAAAETTAASEAPAVEIAATTTPSTEASTPATPAQADVTPTPVVPTPVVPATEVTATEVTATEAAETEVTATQVSEAPATTPAAAPTAQPDRISVLDTGQVIIRRGDNLWRLSRRVYGQGIRYTSIYDANRDQIGRPELIFPGQVFTLPTPQEEWGAVPGMEALDADQIPGEGPATQ